MKSQAIHIREVTPGPTPERRIWNVYVGNEMVDWLAEDLSDANIAAAIRICLQEAKAGPSA